MIRLLAAVSVVAAISMAWGEAPAKPNVILVMTDDQGYGEIGAHGNRVLVTPNLDALHATSIRLTDFHVDPTCSPTRAALLTGRYAHRVGVWHTIEGRSLLRPGETTMAERFAADGYRTGIFGKWHLGDNFPLRPQDRGFQEVLVHGGGGVGQGPDYWGNDYLDDVYFRNGKPESHPGYCTKVWFDAAMQFVESNRDQPFFVYLPTNAAHSPYIVEPRYSNPYLGKGVNAEFYGMIANFDENLGRLLARLKTLGLEENTILIFMTDNGSSSPSFNAGMRGGKGSDYEGGHRVPFFIRWPAGGLTGGKDLDLLTAHIDVLPTLQGLCGLTSRGANPVDGTDLSPWLREGRSGGLARTLVVESQRQEMPVKGRKFSVMSPGWRLVGNELYDLQTDPGQTSNLAVRFPDTVKRMSQAYDTWWTDVSSRDTEQVAISLGATQADSVQLMAHDWHTKDGLTPWNQSLIRSGPRSNGYWAVDFVRAGKYRIGLRRWPEEAKGLPSTAIPARTARPRIGTLQLEQPVANGASEATFEVTVPAGKTRLQTWFVDNAGSSWGAYYVKVITVQPVTGNLQGLSKRKKPPDGGPGAVPGKILFRGGSQDEAHDALGKALIPDTEWQ